MTQSVCDLALGFGEGHKEGEERKMSRPFGVSLLVAGYDRKDGPLLFFSDPSGEDTVYGTTCCCCCCCRRRSLFTALLCRYTKSYHLIRPHTAQYYLNQHCI